MRKIFLAFLTVGFLLSPILAAAQSDIAPEFNPLCWQKADCDQVRLSLKGQTADDGGGWLEKYDECNKAGWGKCLPAGKSKTSIAFGGKTQFADIGDFLKTNYNLALSIIVILAVIMIIVAGIQWASAGGNSEMINSAKKRIGGAVIGMLIAFFSYVILNTINPALVNLRLPQVFMIRPFKVMPEFCSEISTSSAKFSLAAKNGAQIPADAQKKAEFKAVDAKDMACGDKYFVEGGGNSTCAGSKCSKPGNSCINSLDSSNPDKMECQEGDLIVHLYKNVAIKDAIGVLVGGVIPCNANLEKGNWVDQSDVSVSAVCKGTTDKSMFKDQLFTVGGGVCATTNKSSYSVSAKMAVIENATAVPNLVATFFQGPLVTDAVKFLVGEFGFRKWNSSDQLEVKKGQNDDFYFILKKLDPTDPTAKYKEDNWGCGTDAKLAGFVVKFQFKVNCNIFKDADFYVSKNKVGIWRGLGTSGYVSLSDIVNGVKIEAPVDDKTIEDAVANKDTSPVNQRIFAAAKDWVANSLVLPIGKKSELFNGTFKGGVCFYQPDLSY